MTPPPVRRELRIETEFLEAVLRRCPGHLEALEALGHLYTKAGRFQDGLRVDIELTQRQPDNPENWYNLACSQALLQEKESAFSSLDKAVQLGYSDADWMRKDADLKPLHDDPRFRTLLAKVHAA